MNSLSSRTDYPGVSGKCYLVTGASSGIGRECALLLDALGATVILNGRDEERLAATLSQMKGKNHVSAPGDLKELDFKKWLTEQSEKADMPLSGAAHCAGIYKFNPLRAYSDSKLEEVFRDHTVVNASLFNTISTLKSRAPECSLVAMSSISSHYGIVGNAFYGAARAAMESLCRSFAVEYAPIGVRCNMVVGALMQGSSMSGNYFKFMKAGAAEEYADLHPLGLGHVADAANAIIFLLGSASRWITGINLVLDGGYGVKGE